MDNNDIDHRRYEDLLHAYELHSAAQLQYETVYYNRSNLMIVAQGLLFVALPSTLATQILAELIAGLGTWFSLLWWLLEQRQLAYTQSRDQIILLPLETRLIELSDQLSRGFQPFWLPTRSWVANNATYTQRVSLRSIMRSYIPLTFIVCWGAILILLLAGVL